MKTGMDKLTEKRTKKLNRNSKKWKNSLFSEIKMIPQLDSGPLQYRLGNLGDIVCLTQKLEGRLNSLFLTGLYGQREITVSFLYRSVIVFKYLNLFMKIDTILRFFCAGFKVIISNK